MLAYIKENQSPIKNINIQFTGHNRDWIDFLKKGLDLEYQIENRQNGAEIIAEMESSSQF